MCGIVGYWGYRDALPVLIKGLKRLEYRGYDSAGVALLEDHLTVVKKKGKVAELDQRVAGQNYTSKIGIGHTRWATHGEPSDLNAHPHFMEKLFLVELQINSVPVIFLETQIIIGILVHS